MNRYALLGYQIDGSLSPELHRFAWARNRTSADYELWSVSEAQFEDTVQRARDELSGFNLTAPFKQKIIPYLDEQTSRARRLGSVNAVHVRQGRLVGENADWHGVCATLDRLRDHRGSTLILGAGGVLPSVINGLKRFGFGPVTVCCRRPDQLEYSTWGLDDTDRIESFDRRETLLADHALVINATPLGGVAGDELPMRSAVHEGPAHWDLTYRASGTTPWIAAAQKVGLVALDGRVMLIEQAIESQRFWGFDQRCAESMRQLWSIE